jgi:hypothetical protein
VKLYFGELQKVHLARPFAWFGLSFGSHYNR